MKVFLSHAGERSKALAQELQGFVRKLVPSADPWISTGIEKGARWQPEIAENLEAASIGIVCVTSDNLAAPWLLFEAGALSKRLDGRVLTLLLDVQPSAVAAPLSQFQHTAAERDELLALVETINQRVKEVGEQPRHVGDMREQFDTLWPRMQASIEQFKSRPKPISPRRSLEDLVEETLETVRSMARDLNRRPTADEDADAVLREARRVLSSRPDVLASDFDDPRLTASPSKRLRSIMAQTGSPLDVGDKVSHAQFGEGVVLGLGELQGMDADYLVGVRFDRVGAKLLRAKAAKLTKL